MYTLYDERIEDSLSCTVANIAIFKYDLSYFIRVINVVTKYLKLVYDLIIIIIIIIIIHCLR